jgi:AraC-like DNA-binding protein
LYVLNVPQHQPDPQRVRAWRPAVPGVAEVFHARFVEHAYPVHTHDTWTLLIVDDGAIDYDLDRHHHGTVGADVTLLPPHVPHDGRAATRDGFRKRVLYLDAGVLGEELVGAAASGPSLGDPLLRHRIHQLHLALTPENPDGLEGESRLALVAERLADHLRPAPAVRPGGSARLARRLRDLLDARTVDGLTLADAAAELGAHPVHLVRSFTAAYGIAPHAYLTGRRIDRARRLLLCGQTPAAAASAAGFYDQAHLTRQFRRYLGTTPARYAGAVTGSGQRRLAGWGG